MEPSLEQGQVNRNGPAVGEGLSWRVRQWRLSSTQLRQQWVGSSDLLIQLLIQWSLLKAATGALAGPSQLGSDTGSGAGGHGLWEGSGRHHDRIGPGVTIRKEEQGPADGAPWKCRLGYPDAPILST